MNSKIMTILFACMAAAAVVAAENSTEAVLDSNNDGLLSQEEGRAVPGLGEQWETLDVNGDGKLDAAEFARFEPVEIRIEAN